MEPRTLGKCPCCPSATKRKRIRAAVSELLPPKDPTYARQQTRYGPVISMRHPYDPYYSSKGGGEEEPPDEGFCWEFFTDTELWTMDANSEWFSSAGSPNPGCLHFAASSPTAYTGSASLFFAWHDQFPDLEGTVPRVSIALRYHLASLTTDPSPPTEGFFLNLSAGVQGDGAPVFAISNDIKDDPTGVWLSVSGSCNVPEEMQDADGSVLIFVEIAAEIGFSQSEWSAYLDHICVLPIQ